MSEIEITTDLILSLSCGVYLPLLLTLFIVAPGTLLLFMMFFASESS